jgi:hypothetical protein
MPLQALLKDEKATNLPLESPPPASSTTGDGQILNWDVYISTPPPRPEGTIKVELTPGGRSRPIPISDPDTE